MVKLNLLQRSRYYFWVNFSQFQSLEKKTKYFEKYFLRTYSYSLEESRNYSVLFKYKALPMDLRLLCVYKIYIFAPSPADHSKTQFFAWESLRRRPPRGRSTLETFSAETDSVLAKVSWSFREIDELLYKVFQLPQNINNEQDN